MTSLSGALDRTFRKEFSSDGDADTAPSDGVICSTVRCSVVTVVRRGWTKLISATGAEETYRISRLHVSDTIWKAVHKHLSYTEAIHQWWHTFMLYGTGSQPLESRAQTTVNATEANHYKTAECHDICCCTQWPTPTVDATDQNQSWHFTQVKLVLPSTVG